MNATATSRIAAAVMSVIVTLSVLNAIAKYAYPRPATAGAQTASNSSPVVASASK